MTCRFVPVRRIAALSVAITLVAAPIASAQSREPAPAGVVLNHTALLSPAAFRLAKQAPVTGAVGVVPNTAMPNLLRQAAAAMARQAQAAPTQAPQQKSWVSRHKSVLILGAVVGAIVIGAVVDVRAEG